MKLSSIALAVSLAAFLSACGKQESAAPEAAAPAAPEAAAPAAPAPAPEAAGEKHEDSELGKSVYNKVCALCHGVGAAGAPKFGDKADWGPRIAQGKDILYKHALEGFTGQKGAMPARGGNPKLTDDEVKAAVDHMAAQAQ